MKKTVCLIGRPNVGKSSVFNRLIGEKKSIILDTPGITRDRIYGDVEYKEHKFILIDTGGIEIESRDFNDSIKAQAMVAVEEADIIVFVIDGIEELTPDDYLIRDLLLRANKKVIVAVNKLDNQKRQEEYYTYYELGFETVIPISATHNMGILDLLDAITADFTSSQEIEEENLKFSIIGRPNVGKSSLINALLNEERVIVSDIAGTTRDAVDTRFTYEHEEYIAIDTAGMRKKGKIYEEVEKYSLIRSLKAIDRSDVCVIVLNAEEGIIEHDKHIASYALEAGKAIVLCVNKWDSVASPDTDIKMWKQRIENEFQFISYAKLVFTSALTKKRIHTLMPEIIEAYKNTSKELKTSLLNNVIIDATSLHEAPSYKGKRLKIYYVTQTGTKPPKITFYCNDKGLVHFSYERYLENKIRESFDLTGSPIILQFKNRSEDKI